MWWVITNFSVPPLQAKSLLIKPPIEALVVGGGGRWGVIVLFSPDQSIWLTRTECVRLQVDSNSPLNRRKGTSSRS